MALNPALTYFVRRGLESRVPRGELRSALLAAGWPSDQITRALGAYADHDLLPIPVPRPVVSVKPREAFLYALMFLALFVCAYYLGVLLFGVLDLMYPVPYGRPVASIHTRMRWAVSLLVVAAPLFVWIGMIVRRAVVADPSARASRLRQQLTYVTLFVASCVLVASLAVLVYTVLDAGVTVRFLLKLATVVAIAGVAFGWYFTDLRRAEAHPET